MATADTSNSYCTSAQATAYFDSRLHSGTWEAADDEDKERSLIQATRILDSYVAWNEPIDKTAVPEPVASAVCELALVLLSTDIQVVDDMNGLKQISVAGITLVADDKGKDLIPLYIRLMLSDYGSVKGKGGSVELVRS